MSVIVKGMEMPEKCQYCCLLRYYHENGNVWCNANNALLKQGWYTEIDIKRPETCPLVEIPEKHGRLIDADAMRADLATIDPRYKTNPQYKTKIDFCIRVTEAQPTVIEAEEHE